MVFIQEITCIRILSYKKLLVKYFKGDFAMKNKISQFRKTNHLTQRQLAELLGYKNYQYIQQIENNICEPSVSVAIRLASALSTTVEELFILDD